MPPVYSHSRLEVFDACRLRYRLKYVDRIRREKEGIEAFVGSRVHESLEWLYREVLASRTPSVEDLVADYHRRWTASWSDAVVVRADNPDPAAHRRVGEECLRRYHARHAPFRADQTLGVEVRISLDLPGGSRLDGFADRVARDADGWISVHDYKTSSTLPAQQEADRDRQLALYQAGVERMWPGAPGTRLVWHYLRFDERLVSVRGREQQAALLHETQDRIRRVEQETRWEPTVSALCDWCPYWDLCPEKRHEWALARRGREEPSLLPSDADGAEAAARDLAAAVDALGRRRAAQADLDAAKERLAAYARAAGVTRVATPAGSATIRLGEADSLPRKGEPGHERLRAAVLAARIYDAYADLDTARLLADARSGALPGDLADAVLRLARPRPVARVVVRPAAGGAAAADPAGEEEAAEGLPGDGGGGDRGEG